MYNNRIVRRLDGRGRICIPRHVRLLYSLEGEKMEVFTENDLICLRKYDPDAPRVRIYTRGSSPCNFCVCSSCSGFGCPWIVKQFRYHVDRLTVRPARCDKCLQRRLERIHDCDFYTSRKRKKFYIKRKWVHKVTKHDIVMRELLELKKILEERRL